MKTKLIILGTVLLIIALVLTQIYKSGSEHIDVIEEDVILKADNKKLVQEKEVLQTSIKQLEKNLDSTGGEIIIANPIETLEVIKRVKEYITLYDTIIVHDTVFIKEQKNFWGKTKSDTLE
jgi:uncharacterized protein YlxW (UPF0749 family)